MSDLVKVAVVGHVEWVEFVSVRALPARGEIIEAEGSWEQAAGGGAVAAVQLARLAGECVFYTALGDDERGHEAKRELERLGVVVEAAWRPEPQRRALVFIDERGERTITTIGERLAPEGDDPLRWAWLGDAHGVYLTAGDAGAVRLARAAASLVCTPRAGAALRHARQPIDVLVCSATDEGERYESGDLDPAPAIVARTEGANGGSLEGVNGFVGRWDPISPPGQPVDSYGAGDSFAAGLTYGLAEGRSPEEAAELGARCGAACVSGRGPYEGQLRRPGG